MYRAQDVVTDLECEGEPIPTNPVREDWLGHRVSASRAKGAGFKSRRGPRINVMVSLKFFRIGVKLDDILDFAFLNVCVVLVICFFFYIIKAGKRLKSLVMLCQLKGSDSFLVSLSCTILSR